MSKSYAKRRREQKIKEGHLDPSISRLDWGDIKPITRMTPTRKEKIEKKYKKYKKVSGNNYEC